jgi:hypothetical protein
MPIQVECRHWDQHVDADQHAHSVPEATSKPSKHSCSECQATIIPYTKRGIFNHRLSAGHKTVIDLDPTQILADKRRIAGSRIGRQYLGGGAVDLATPKTLPNGPSVYFIYKV